MTFRTFFWGAFWSLIALALIFHVGAGWYFSGVLIEDGFVPQPDALETPSGDYELLEVTYESPLGPMDAWHLPAAGTTWVIHVHGRTSTPDEAEPLFAPLQEAGYSQLAITFRNDDQQPEDPSGFLQFGATEYEDLAGAVDFALANGAEELVFNGFSTGASHVLSFVLRQPGDRVAGVLMDSPNIDFGDTVDFAASQRDLPILPFKVPQTVSAVAKFFTSLRISINWKAIDYISKSEDALRHPVFIHHGTEDETVPIEQSRELVELHPDLVRLVEVPGAGHIDSYDVDFEGYVARVLGFLAEVG
ncbi:MAG: alpha/beta hydrolase [Acidimicrobiia bacterium]